MTKNARGKTLIYGFPCSHIIATCQHQCVDFWLFIQGYYTTQSYYDTWASLFHPISNEDELPLYDGPTIVPPKSMKRIGSGHPKSTRLHNEMDVREGKTTITYGFNRVTIDGLVRIEIKFNDRCEVTHFFFFFFFFLGGGGGGGGGGNCLGEL